MKLSTQTLAVMPAVAAMTLCAPVVAHHSPASLYLLDRTIAIEGVVTDYQFVNPHARIFLRVDGGDGSVVEWMAEGGTPNILIRQGWSGDEVQPGDRVRIEGNPARDGSNLIHWVTILLPDGRELYGEDINYDAIDRRRRRE